MTGLRTRLACAALTVALLVPHPTPAEESEARPGRDYACHTVGACEPAIGCARTGGPRVTFHLIAQDFGAEIGQGFLLRSLGPDRVVLFFPDIETARSSLDTPRSVPDGFAGVIFPDHGGNWMPNFRISSAQRLLRVRGFVYMITDPVSRVTCDPLPENAG